MTAPDEPQVIEGHETRMASIRPKALIFTLFGDYIRHRGGEIWTGSLIRLMRLLGVPSGQAVRSALSRMGQRGWLQSRKVGRQSYYSLTPRGERLLHAGAARIFEGRREAWDGRWRLLALQLPEEMATVRARLRQELGWIGFGRLESSLYVAPYDYEDEVAALFQHLAVGAQRDLFVGHYRGAGSDRALAARAWELPAINAAYLAFLQRWEPRHSADAQAFADPALADPPPAHCFQRRFMLLHEYRVFPFLDPDLPPALLPPDWHGHRARSLFHAYYELLTAPALTFFDEVFQAAPTDDEGE